MSNFLKVGQPSLHFVLWLVQKTTGVMLLVETQTPHSGTWSHISLLFGDLDRTVTTFLKVHFYYLYVNNLFYKRNSSWDLKKKKKKSEQQNIMDCIWDKWLTQGIQVSSHAMRGILTSYMIIFFQSLIPTLLVFTFYFDWDLFPNHNFVSILMTVFICHCHQGSQEKLITIYSSFLKNFLRGALSFVCHYVNHILILHL